MLYERVTDSPSFVSKEYETEYKSPLIPNERNEGIWQEFYGTGIPIDGHPLERHINFGDCGACESSNVKVIYATWSVSTASGDSYWDAEIVCDDCGKFTARSFNEND
jgi:hypothetical protein